MSRASLALTAAVLLALPAAAAVVREPFVDPALRVLASEEPALMLSASGVQIFECRPTLADPNAFAWSYVAPDATLYDGGRSAARHATPNHWEALGDRTSVSGVPRATQPAGSNNLPWLLLRAIPAGEDGIFAGVTSIQRVNTSGGVAPATGCSADAAGAEARVAFTADFYFYKRRGA